MSFAQIIGHSETLSVLSRYLSADKVPHALLLSGHEGVGKSLIAKNFAKALCCLKIENGEPCQTCSNCRKIDGGYHPDVLWVYPEGKSNTITIDQIRTVKNNLFLKPFESRRKVCIIEEAHTMNEQAANALLKILEEPPAYSHLFLISDKPYYLLPTIRSRCHMLYCRPIEGGVLNDYLVRELGLTADEARRIALFAGGSIGRARHLALNQGIYRIGEAVTELLLGSGGDDILRLLAKIGRVKGFFQDLETELTEKIKNEKVMPDEGATAKEKKAAEKELETQSRAKGSILLLKEFERMLDFSLFVWRDLLLLKNDCASMIANTGRREYLTARAGEMELSTILSKIAAVETFRRYLEFNVGVYDLIELFFLKMARAF